MTLINERQQIVGENIGMLQTVLAALLLLVSLVTCFNLNDYALSTAYKYAGKYQGSQTSVDGNLTSATFGSPSFIALNVQDNILYTADGADNKLRAINMTSGQVTTIAGNGMIFC